ncbi:hypothetical protein I4U23_011304 [Adineta vaga]|nr:hypothetical protein I4U23_011304 [Adineta vaga]
MIIFGLLIIRNVRCVQNRVVPHAVGNVRNERLRSNDRQLVVMLLYQVLITILISIPYAVVNMYNALSLVMMNNNPSPMKEAILLCVGNSVTLLYGTNPVTGFYIYTLTGPKFRVEVKQCCRTWLHSVLTTLGLARCLPLRVQRALLNTLVAGVNNAITVQSRRENTADPAQ